MPSGKVLVVDDAKAIVDSLTKALQRLGIAAPRISTASTFTGALETFNTERPQVVFMDMDLAGEPGDAAAQQILDIDPTVKLVVMTGMDPSIPRVRAVVSAGAYAVIEKPIRLTRLREVLDLIDAEEKGLRRVM